MNTAGMCWTMSTGTPAVFTNAGRNSDSATGPPVDTPTTTTATGSARVRGVALGWRGAAPPPGADTCRRNCFSLGITSSRIRAATSSLLAPFGLAT